MGNLLHMVIVSLSLQGATAAGLDRPTAAAPAIAAPLATYVPVCKNSRGVFDRRACGGKSSPRRMLLT